MTQEVKQKSGSKPEEQSSAHFFESSSDISKSGNRVTFETEDSRLQKKNLAVIRNILETFNLEETKKKYETQNVVEYCLDPNDFGYDCSLSTTRVRQRLCDLMGTDVIRLNDKLYFQKLSQRLQEEYETTMDKQEEARAASEEERLRRLMLEGVIDAPNDYRAVLQGHGKQSKKKKKRRKIKRHVSEPIPDTSKASDDEGQTKTRKEDVVTQVAILSDSQTETSNKEPENRKQTPKKVSIEENENTSQKINEMHARPPHHEAALRTSSAGSTSRKSRRIKSAAPRVSHWEKDRSFSDDGEVTDDADYDTQSLPERHYIRKTSKYSRQEPERVSRLRGAETVEGLYSIAEELVCPNLTDDQPSRKVPLKTKPKKITVMLS